MKDQSFKHPGGGRGTMHMVRKTACILLAAVTILLTGCWNNREITDLAIVVGMGIDKAPDGNIEMTVQIVSTSKSSGSQIDGSSFQGSDSTVTVDAEGSTLFEATRNLIPSLSHKAYYSQMQLLVIGEDAAKGGLNDIWDFLERDHEINRLFRVLVVKSDTAKSVLEAKAGVGQIGAAEIANTIDDRDFGGNVNLRAYRMSELLSNPLTGIVTGSIGTNGATDLTAMKIQGGAVFKHGILAGYLDTNQTKGYLFAQNQLQSTILAIANPKETGKLVSLEVIRSTGKLTAAMKNGKPKLGIEIDAFGNVGEEQGGADLSDEKDVNALQSEAEALISGNISDMLRQSQQVFDCDILGFNELLYKYHCSDFEKIQSNWNEVYRSADIGIQVRFQIKRPGIIKKPAYTD